MNYSPSSSSNAGEDSSYDFLRFDSTKQVAMFNQGSNVDFMFATQLSFSCSTHLMVSKFS